MAHREQDKFEATVRRDNPLERRVFDWLQSMRSDRRSRRQTIKPHLIAALNQYLDVMEGRYQLIPVPVDMSLDDIPLHPVSAGLPTAWDGSTDPMAYGHLHRVGQRSDAGSDGGSHDGSIPEGFDLHEGGGTVSAKPDGHLVESTVNRSDGSGSVDEDEEDVSSGSSDGGGSDVEGDSGGDSGDSGARKPSLASLTKDF